MICEIGPSNSRLNSVRRNSVETRTEYENSTLNQKPSGYSLDQIHELTELIPAAIWQMDAETYDFEYVSKGAEAILGFPIEDWLADPKFWVKHLHPEDRRWAVSFCQSAVEAGKPHEFEYRMIDSKGEIVWIRDLVRVVKRDGELPKIVGLMIDVSRRHKSERDKVSIEEQIRSDRTAEAMGELTASVAHDFNNALTVVSMHVDLLRNGVPKDQVLTDSIGAIEMAIDEASSLTKSLMAIGRDFPSEKRQLDLRKAVAGAHRMVRRVLPAGIKLHVENECETPLRVCADALRIQQLILSLTLDARNNMSEGGELTISLMPHESAADVGVDNSEGFSTSTTGFARLCFAMRRSNMIGAKQDQPTERRASSDDTMTAAAEHYPAVLDIVEDHRAIFGYEPTTGGTTIRVDFPCSPCSPDRAERHEETSATAASNVVLIAGEDQQVRDIVAASLRDSGFGVIPLASRAALENKFYEAPQSINLIVLDTNLQDGGAEFLQGIRGKGHQTAVIVLTGADKTDGFGKADGVTKDAKTTLLRKPFSTNALIRLAQGVLSRGT